MLGRIIHFLPEVIVLLIIFAAALLYATLCKSKIEKAEEEKILSEQELDLKVFMHIMLPQVLITGPILEELIFRLPLIIMFERITWFSIVGAVISAFLFSFSHLLSSIHFLEDNISSIFQRKMSADKIETSIQTMFYGFIFGFYGIEFQSIAYCAIIHSFLNLLCMFYVLKIASDLQKQ